jgi:hypothetical protein
VLAAALSTLIVMLLTATSALFLHWFVVPLIVCGTLIGIEMVEWLQGRLSLYDPAGMISLLGFHTLFLAPLLLVLWNYRMLFIPCQPDDYREWLGIMATINLAGLVLYRAILANSRKRREKPLLTSWVLQPRRFWSCWTIAVSICAGFEGWLFVYFGGLNGLATAYSAWLHGQDTFQNMALFFAVSESLPIVLLIGFVVWARGRSVGPVLITTVLAAFVTLQMLVGGLRGSRSNVIWMIFWAVGLIHFTVRRIPRTIALCSIALLYGFISLYGAYKQHGVELFSNYKDTGDYASLNEGSEGAATVLVGDLSRSDVQAYVVYQMLGVGTFEYAWGQSYLGALEMLIPKAALTKRTPTITKWTTDIEYGRGAFDSGMTRSSRVYGIAGEAMLNFGPIGVIPAFAALGLIVAGLQSFLTKLPRSDARVLIAPFVINFTFLLLLNDSDNAIFYLVKYGLVPGLLVLSASIRIPSVRSLNGNSDQYSRS